MLAQAESDGLLLPNDTPFKQQQLKVWTPQLTFPCVIATYGIAALFFIILGAAIAASSNAVVTISRTYHDDPGCVAVSGSNSLTCSINLTIEKDMDAPVYFYYKLTNYYQNHRTYVKSRDDAQLRNGAQTTKNCAPLEKYGDYFNGSQPSLNDKVLYPCGLIANSFFNDKFPSAQYCPSGGSCATLSGDNWRSKGIAYSSDFHKFRTRDMAPSETNISPFPYASTFTLPSVEDEDFMVWMRTGTTSDVVKLNKKIMHQDLKKGDQLIVEISNQYPLSVFSGEKHIILSTSSWIGTKNAFLGVAMIVLGVLSVVAGLAFAFRFWTLKRSGALSNNSPWKSSFSIGSGESQQSMTDTAGRIEQASRS